MGSGASSPGASSPGSIGVVGGGQLALMLAQAGQQLGVEVHVQTPGGSDPATAAASSVVQAALRDSSATRLLAERSDVITFENEWVDLAALAPLQAGGIRFVPKLEALAPLICKRSQRQLLERLNLPTPRWFDLPIDGVLPEGMAFPLMAKVSSGGYDGKGTAVLHSQQELDALVAAVKPEEWFLENLVNFSMELSQLACRDHSGQVHCYPLVQTHQHQQVCDWVLTPAAVPHGARAFARNIAASLLTALDYVGVLSVELFYGPGGMQVNEIAPRTHNSGHLTIEACLTSQFEQQVRIAAGLAPGPVGLKMPGALMVNLLGFEHSQSDYAERRQQLEGLPGASVHWYGKQGSNPGRKLGHVTLPLDGQTPEHRLDQALLALAQVRSIWPLPMAHPLTAI